MTKDDLIAEISAICDLLGAAPEMTDKERARISLDRIDCFFDMCDKANEAISEAYGRLDALTVLDLDEEAG
jgi:hypothetical protein